MSTSDNASTGATVIPVMYRDASNYKAYGLISLDGIITDHQIGALRQCLGEGRYYVPRQLGLAHLAEETWPGSHYDDDHDWHEMFLDEITTSQTSLTPGVDTQNAGTVDEFLARLRGAARAGWHPDRD